MVTRFRAEGRSVLLGVVGVLALIGPGLGRAPAQEVVEAQETQMARTVLAQLEAFRRGDFASAYGFASREIQAQFSLEAFSEMVSRGYAPIARPDRSRVLKIRVIDARRGLVGVRVYGQNGQIIDALYEVVEEQGAWKVNGVLARPVDLDDFVRWAPPRAGPGRAVA